MSQCPPVCQYRQAVALLRAGLGFIGLGLGTRKAGVRLLNPKEGRFLEPKRLGFYVTKTAL